MATCRDCTVYVPADKAVRYSLRHNLCETCAILRGLDFLKTLKTRQLEQLPIQNLKSNGLLHAITDEIESRPDNSLKLALDRRFEQGRPGAKYA